MLKILVCLKCNLKLFKKRFIDVGIFKNGLYFCKTFHLGNGLGLGRIVPGIGLGLGFDICGLDYITDR